MSENTIASEPQPRRKFKKGDFVKRGFDCSQANSVLEVVRDEVDGRVYFLDEEGDEVFNANSAMILVRAVDTQPDLVNHPPHYTASATGIECIQAIEAALTPEEFRGFCKGNAIKYAWREKHKGGDQDLQKAAWYLARLTKEKEA
jgi:hypothetical protein